MIKVRRVLWKKNCELKPNDDIYTRLVHGTMHEALSDRRRVR
jgi:hypothetical protein